MTKASHQSLRKDLMTFFDYMIYLSVNDEYAFSGRTINMLPFKGSEVWDYPARSVGDAKGGYLLKLFRLFSGIEQV